MSLNTSTIGSLFIALLGTATGCLGSDSAVAGGGGGGGSDGTASATDGATGGSADAGVDGSGSATGGSDGTADSTADATAADADSSSGGEACGNDVVEGDEACDGTDLAGDDCAGQGFDAGPLACNDDCTFDVSGCVMTECGDDVTDGSEVCDGAELKGETCVSQGFVDGRLACLADCSGYDTSGCLSCGNDVVDMPETCDGVDLGGADCVSEGFDGGELACAPACDAFDTSACFDFTGNCCSANGTPGCADAACTTSVCAADAACCNVDWDATCAAAAIADPMCQGVGGSCPTCGDDFAEGPEACDGSDLSGDCVSAGFDAGVLACAGDCSLDTAACYDFGGAGDCCAANGSAGCSDMGCTQAICAADPQCCTTDWDAMCAAAAVSAPECAGTGSCPACGDDTAEGAEPCDGSDLSGETCGSQGFDGGSLDCQADCSGFDTAACTNFVGDCCAANGSPGCDDAACTSAICASDPSCCVDWDAGCAADAAAEPACLSVGGSCATCGDGTAEAPETCDGADLGGEDCMSQGFDSGALTCQADCLGLDSSGCADFSGDCCSSNGTPGCNDASCTAAVCAGDPSCCAGSWDAACAAAAVTEPSCQNVGGSCPSCGDDLIEGLEACDGTDLGGADCTTQGFDGGTLGCQADCSALDESICQDVGYGDCVNNLPAAVCQAEEQCITDLAVPPTQGVCADVSCGNVDDCPLAQPGGTAPVQCVDITGEGINECIMFCGAPGLNCPAGMICAVGIACAWPAVP